MDWQRLAETAGVTVVLVVGLIPVCRFLAREIFVPLRDRFMKFLDHLDETLDKLSKYASDAENTAEHLKQQVQEMKETLEEVKDICTQTAARLEGRDLPAPRTSQPRGPRPTRQPPPQGQV